jgi:gluconokinase
MSSVLDEVEVVEPAPNILSVRAETKPAFLLSLDVGTSGVRAALFDDHGNEIKGAQINSPRTLASFSDFGELDADAIVEQVVETVDDLLSVSLAAAGSIKLISISSFWHSLIGVDADGRATTPLLTWADTRAANIAIELRTKFDEGRVHHRTGCRFHPSYWPAKLLWLKSEQPDTFARTERWLGFAEYLCLRLFGEATASVSMASATGLVDQRSCDWDWPFVESLGINATSLPAITAANGVTQLNESFALRWPLLAEARLARVVGDGAANNVGGGCSTRDKAALMVGTSGAMRVVYRGDPPETLSPALWCYRVDRERVVVGGALSDGGGLYRWLTDSLAIIDDPHDLEKKLSLMEADAHGLTVLPFWSGERSTGWAPHARGGILGLTQETTPVEIIRAALESIAYRFALITRALDSVVPGFNVIATGNALRSSPAWLQIICDVLGRPVIFGSASEASMRGAALLALEAVGKIGNIDEVTAPIDKLFEPDMKRHARYQQGLARQEELYHRLLER